MQCLDASYDYVVYEWAGEDGVLVVKEEASLDSVLGLFKQVILALYAMQQSNPPFIHHDLKWHNVAVDRKCLRLIDLDDHVEGIWRNKRGPGVWTPVYAPPEQQGQRDAIFFCGLHSHSSPARNAVCPGAYAFDVFSAGMMASEACALDWMTIALYGTVRGTRDFARREGLKLDEAVPLHGMVKLKERVDRLSTDLKGFKAQKVINFVKHFHDQRLEEVAQKAMARLTECQKKPGTIDVIQSMLASTPSNRPTPGQVLKSSLLKDVRTNCDLDIDLDEDEIVLLANDMSSISLGSLQRNSGISISLSYLCLVVSSILQ